MTHNFSGVRPVPHNPQPDVRPLPDLLSLVVARVAGFAHRIELVLVWDQLQEGGVRAGGEGEEEC